MELDWMEIIVFFPQHITSWNRVKTEGEREKVQTKPGWFCRSVSLEWKPRSSTRIVSFVDLVTSGVALCLYVSVVKSIQILYLSKSLNTAM